MPKWTSLSQLFARSASKAYKNRPSRLQDFHRSPQLTTAFGGSGINFSHFVRENQKLPLPHESATEPVTELPKPELNPMLNPTLGRNLGRWAHVYFTSPPEKREQAVLELLRELEAESGAGSAAEPINLNGVPSNEASTRVATEARVIPETVLCAECGHQNARPQRYCGMCGSPLTADDPMPRSPEHEPQPARASDITLRESPVVEPAFPTLSLFAQANDERSSRGSEIRWLRDRDMDDEDATSPVLKYVLIVLVILVAGAFFYNRSRMQAARGPGEQGSSGVWTGTRSPSQPSPVPAPANPPSTATPGVAAKPADNAPQVSPPPTASPAPVKESTPEPQKVGSARDAGQTPNVAHAEPRQAPLKATTSPEVPPATAETSSVTNGSAELAMAEEYLHPKRGPRNSAVAATFLWRAVSKENTTATLLLSDLYRTGDGVPKSCDQARVLLYAAARKNVPEAGQKLRALQAGCP